MMDAARAVAVPALAVPAPTLIVGIGELMVSADPDAQLVTYALGSCLGITIHDPVACVGGLLHVMLPSSELNAEDAKQRPERFVDSGVPLLFKECYKLGAVKHRLAVKVAGGAAATPGDTFAIGRRNLLALRKLLWNNGVLITGEDTGGAQVSRTMALDVRSGVVTLRVGHARLHL